MKAFHYLTALGLGAAVSLGEAAVLPPIVRAQATVESAPAVEVEAEETQDVAAPTPSSTASSNQLSQIAQSVSGLVMETQDLAPVVVAQATTAEPEVAQVAQPPASQVPIDTTSDPVEQEFLGEPTTPQPVTPAQTSPTQPVPPATPDEMTPVDGSTAPAPPPPVALPPLTDQQPNLTRPTNADDVVIQQVEAISLEEAIAIARQNNPTIRIQQLQVDQSQAAVDQAKAARSPQASVNAQGRQTGTMSRTDVIYNEPPTTTDYQTSRQADLTGSGNVRVDYNLIAPGRAAAIRAAEKQKAQAELSLNQALAQLRLDVSQSYYALQNADEQVEIARESVRSAQQSLKDAQSLERAGVGTRFAVLQAEVQLANTQQQLITNISNQQKAQRALSQQLSVEQMVNVTAADPVRVAGQWATSLQDSIVLAYQNRVELDNQLLQREISDARREIALAANKPTVSLFAQAGPSAGFQFSRQFSRTATTNRQGTESVAKSGTFSPQLDYTLGVNFQWQFFDGGAAKASARQRELDKSIAEEQFENVRDGVRQEVENAFYDLQSNFNNIATSEKGVTQAEDALRLARLRFQAGVGTQTEVVDAERDLTTARGNRVSAILNYNLALVQMQRAVGESLTPPPYESPVYEAPEKTSSSQ